MKKLITTRRWKEQIRRKQLAVAKSKRRKRYSFHPPKEKRTFEVIHVPANFSIIQNPDEMNTFLRTFRAYGKRFHIELDLTAVTIITTDAIAALAATIAALPDTDIRGNMPNDQVAKKVLLSSGFFEHVLSAVQVPKGSLGKIKERKSKRVEPKTARELIECGTCQAFGSTKISHSSRASYTTLIEAMGNTHNHAAGKKSVPETWWATSYGDSTRKRVCYTFLDTGVGIFRSVRLGWIRRAFLGIGVQSDANILLEILEGRVESRTGLSYRGKGLPAIYKKAQNGDLKSLFIIANGVYADVSNGVYRSLKTPFDGTLLYWESEE